MLSTIIDKIWTEIINPFILLMMAVAAVYFIWGVFLFVKNSADDADKGEGKKHMVYGIIGLFIMISVEGIIALIKATVS
jgi:hypothetical protein